MAAWREKAVGTRSLFSAGVTAALREQILCGLAVRRQATQAHG
jgi:hypothetical protein